MPRFARGTRSVARRTNWTSYTKVETVVAGAQNDLILLDPTDSTTEISKYVNPTLVRTRGYILVDPSTSSGTTGSQFSHTWAALYVGETAIASLIPSGTAAQGGWNSDSILWTGAQGYSSHGTQSTAVGWDRYVYEHQPMVVESKAMRKLEDRFKVRLAIANYTGGQDVIFLITLRFLIKE